MFYLGQKVSLESFKTFVGAIFRQKYYTLRKIGLFPETVIISPSEESERKILRQSCV